MCFFFFFFFIVYLIEKHKKIYTAAVDKGRAMDVIYLDFCKAFDMVRHNIFLSEWDMYGFDGWTVWWMKKWMDGGNQRAVVDGSMA